MKRIAVMLLCLCMVLPMVLAMVFSAGATTASVTIFTDKEIYNVGDGIKLSVEGATTGWVGIVPANADGEPITDHGGLYWKYVRDLDDTSITTGTAMKANNVNTLAGELGLADGAALLAVPAGDYFAFYVSDESLGLPGAVKAGDVIYKPFTVANKFHLEKTAFTYGEAINVIPVAGSGTDWIGISPVSDDGTINRSTRYIYIDTANGGRGIGVANDIRAGIVNGNAAEPIKHLPAGRYVLYFVPNNGAFANRDKSTELYIDILGATVEKTEFKYGEPIMVKGYGSGKDWVGIGVAPKAGEKVSTSIRWRYVVADSANAEEQGLGSGVAFDIREAKLTGGGASKADIPVGEYVIFVGLNNCDAPAASPYTYIPITVTAEKPEQPAEVKYELDDKSTGLAGGKLTVTFAESAMEMYKKATHVALFWGDAEGNALDGFGEICSRKVVGTTTVIELTDSMVIPEGAKQLMVRAYNGAGSADAVGATLPADRSYRVTGDKVTSFQIVSDMHIGRTNTDGEGDVMSEKHANMMFADIMALDPDSVGIFVAGDAADHGQVAEYERLLELWVAANANGLKPQLYIGVGNHEMMKDTAGHNYSSDYEAQMNRFLIYANKSLAEAEKTTTPYYYVNRGGQHFIFLATEYCGTHAYLSDAQLSWLESKLAAVAADGAPVFIMLHQPLYNTIAGGLANEDGSKRQGWHGVIAGDVNFELWQAESGGNLSDHGKMYGQYEAPLRDILKQYPSAMMFGGHSHWIMQSVGNIYEATAAQPNYMFNTASVSYLWTDNDELYGGVGTDPGSQGYFVTVYENCIELRGRDFRNGEWIPGAYYRIWLDCAHEYDHDCATICKWCGEIRTDAPADHTQDAVCTDDECNVCGEKVTLQPHEGEKRCSAKCMHCGIDIEHEEHVGEKACSTTCKYGCGTAIEATAEHETDHACDAFCKSCNEAVEHAEHEGVAACATVCKHGCGTAIAPTADHTTLYECDAGCRACGEAVAHVEHVGKKACSTTCRYGCGTVLTFAEGHVGLHECSSVCKYCGEPKEPESAHRVHVVCRDTACLLCGEAVTPTPHAGRYACSVVCQYGCGSAVEPTSAHDFGEWEIITQPTATAEGIKQHKCLVCGKAEKEKIEATGVGTGNAPDANGNAQGADKQGEVSDQVVMISIAAGTVVVALGAISSIVIVRMKKKRGR
ncbi:MAG: hypothetical protein E7590_00175 [Ruminococcaceae bacterium]|nr:hypothetical protein [Oscillospiraceae bacterium]